MMSVEPFIWAKRKGFKKDPAHLFPLKSKTIIGFESACRKACCEGKVVSLARSDDRYCKLCSKIAEKSA